VRRKRSIRNYAEHWRVSWKSTQGRPSFSYGLKWNCIYAGTVKPCDILEVKNAFVTSTRFVGYCFTTYTLCVFCLVDLPHTALGHPYPMGSRSFSWDVKGPDSETGHSSTFITVFKNILHHIRHVYIWSFACWLKSVSQCGTVLLICWQSLSLWRRLWNPNRVHCHVCRRPPIPHTP
jgi:hypothetical protein